MTESDSNKTLIGALLVENGVISEAQLERGLADQKKFGGRIGYHLVRCGFISTAALSDFLVAHPYAGRIHEEANERQKAAQVLPRSLAYYYKIAPIRVEGKALTVALSEISHPNLVQTLAEITGKKIIPLIAPETEIRSLLDSSYLLPSDAGIEFSAFGDNVFVVMDARKNTKALAPGQLNNTSSSPERLRSMIAEAIHEKCREIIIKPQTSRSAVFFRKESFRQTEFAISPEQQEELAFLILRLAKMNLLQNRRPQSGRFTLKFNDRKITLTVVALPSIFGVQLRLEMFDEKILKHAFDEIVAPFPEVRESVEHFLNNSPRGIYAITGPAASGRTIFLYSLIARSKQNFKKITTFENSIRYPISGIHQEEFSDGRMEAALEELSNHPPELLAIHAISTIRQAELAFLLAARIPVLAIFSSFDSFKLIEWLCSHNLKSPIKAGLLHTVVSPRTIAQICPHCAVPLEFDAQTLPPELRSSGMPLKMNQGCDYCRGQQSSGRTFLEILRMDEEATQWILKDHSASSLRKQARTAGRKTLYDLVARDAVQKQLDMLSVAKLQAAL